MAPEHIVCCCVEETNKKYTKTKLLPKRGDLQQSSHITSKIPMSNNFRVAIIMIYR
jgi:hypothetical protein